MRDVPALKRKLDKLAPLTGLKHLAWVSRSSRKNNPAELQRYR